MSYIKNNKMTILVILILVGFAIASALNMNWEYNLSVLSYKTTIEKCNTELKDDHSFDAMCEKYRNWEGPKRSDSNAIFMFLDIIHDNIFWTLQTLLPFLILMCTIDRINKKLKNGWIKNELTRKKYKNFIFSEWLHSVKQLWIIPFIFIFVLIISYLMTGNFDYQNSLVGPDRINRFQEFYSTYYSEIFDNIPRAIVVCSLNFFMQGIFIINIGYIMTKKSKNYILSVITSYMVFVALWIVSEFYAFYIEMPKLHNYFSFSAIWSETNYIVILVQLFYVTITSFFVYVAYRHKEEVIMLNE